MGCVGVVGIVVGVESAVGLLLAWDVLAPWVAVSALVWLGGAVGAPLS